jgi:branched-chain amino acid transport system ATP-binding protein
MALLETRSLTVSYGGLRAVDDVSISVEPGQLVGLIGPNGAGKTTFVDALTGAVASRGGVRFAGRPLDGLPSYRRARCGLARTWQQVELFDELSVRENLQVAAERQSVASFLADLVHPRRRRDSRAVDSALGLLELNELADRMPSELSEGERKLVGVARSLAAAPKLVCMDEPAAGLDTDESRGLGVRLRSIVDHGTSVLLIDHDMGLVFGVCDWVYVLEFGSIIAEGPPEAVRRDERVIAAYLGTSGAASAALEQR